MFVIDGTPYNISLMAYLYIPHLICVLPIAYVRVQTSRDHKLKNRVPAHHKCTIPTVERIAPKKRTKTPIQKKKSISTSRTKRARTHSSAAAFILREAHLMIKLLNIDHPPNKQQNNSRSYIKKIIYYVCVCFFFNLKHNKDNTLAIKVHTAMSPIRASVFAARKSASSAAAWCVVCARERCFFGSSCIMFAVLRSGNIRKPMPFVGYAHTFTHTHPYYTSI